MSELNEMQKLFLYWINERESIRVKKEQGLPKPWTNDVIFQQYKFTNVEREKDTVSIWIKENWIDPYQDHPNLWFAMIVARLFNWPPTLERIGFPDFREPIRDKIGEFEINTKEQFTFWLNHCRAHLKILRDVKHQKVFTGAYLVSTNGVQMDKIDYILDRVLTPIWENGRAPTKEDTLESYWEFLTQFDGLGSFMAGQVIADLKYSPLLENAFDWWTWAPLGPGSIRGLNRYHGRPVDKALRQDQGLCEIREQQKLIEDKLGWLLPAHNIQNCDCEFYKYTKIKYNGGRTRSLYPGLK